MRKIWNIFMTIVWVAVIVWMIYHRADIRVWLNQSVGEIPVRHVIGICFVTAWFGSSLILRRK